MLATLPAVSHSTWDHAPATGVCPAMLHGAVSTQSVRDTPSDALRLSMAPRMGASMGRAGRGGRRGWCGRTSCTAANCGRPGRVGMVGGGQRCEGWGGAMMGGALRRLCGKGGDDADRGLVVSATRSGECSMWWGVQHVVGSAACGGECSMWWGVQHVVGSAACGGECSMWWGVQHVVGSAACGGECSMWWGVQHVVGSAACGGECSMWWGVQHVVGSAACGGECSMWWGVQHVVGSAACGGECSMWWGVQHVVGSAACGGECSMWWGVQQVVGSAALTARQEEKKQECRDNHSRRALKAGAHSQQARTHSRRALTAGSHSQHARTHSRRALTAGAHSQQARTHSRRALTAGAHSQQARTHSRRALTAGAHSQQARTHSMRALTAGAHSQQARTHSRRALTAGAHSQQARTHSRRALTAGAHSQHARTHSRRALTAGAHSQQARTHRPTTAPAELQKTPVQEPGAGACPSTVHAPTVVARGTLPPFSALGCSTTVLAAQSVAVTPSTVFSASSVTAAREERGRSVGGVGTSQWRLRGGDDAVGGAVTPVVLTRHGTPPHSVPWPAALPQMAQSEVLRCAMPSEAQLLASVRQLVVAAQVASVLTGKEPEKKLPCTSSHLVGAGTDAMAPVR
ncbi:unnamed protein product [Closterium sp. Naga37s-1]|nr:unnamed protein product [Closterium sp. Naga37s-1]